MARVKTVLSALGFQLVAAAVAESSAAMHERGWPPMFVN